MHEKLPKEIKVGPYIYQILLKDNIRDDGDRKCFGICVHHEHVIMIDVLCPEDRARVVVIHELLHALMELVGLDKEAYKEEEIVVALAPALTMLLMDNPTLLEYLNAR